MALSLPRLDVAPYDDPETFVDTWDETMDAIEDAVDGAGAGSGYLAEIDGVGRIAGSDYLTTDAGAPQLPASPSLAVLLPNDTVIYVENTRVVIDELGSGLHLTGVPDNFEGYGYATTVDLGGGVTSLEIAADHWSATLRPDWTALGYYCIGKVTSVSGEVTAIDKTNEDRILPNPMMRQLAEQGGGESGMGEVTRLEFETLQAEVAALAVRVAALEAATGTGTTSTSNASPHEMTRRSMVLASQANDRVDDFKDYPGSLFIRDVTGSGEETSTQTLPDVRDGGEWES